MARLPDSGKIDFAEVFHRVEAQMLAQFATSGLFEHASSQGTATEQQWIEFFLQYLPSRFRAAPAFIVNSAGLRSRQIDIAIYDNLHSWPLFPHPAGVHIPVESVYAVFEVKPSVSRQWLRDAGQKAESVRALQSSNRTLLAGLLAASSLWKAENFAKNVRSALADLPPSQRIDLGCALEHTSFDNGSQKLELSRSNETLFFFTLRLIARLHDLGPIPHPDILSYAARPRDES
jgi:hypothetical protein